MLFSVFFKKKTLVIVGGYDAAYVPEIDYGLFLDRRGRIQTRFVYKHSDKILVVDPALKDDIIRNTHLNIENKIRVVPTGYDFNKWVIGGTERKNLAITVGAVNWENLKRKGFETFVKAARYLPDTTFVLVGKHLDNSADYLKSIATSNVVFSGFVSDSDLLRFYQEASVYCQLSRYEGLPNSLCEAMLCGCIPIGTKYCGVPTAMGNMGFYVPYGDEEATARVIQKALSTLARREDIRERIKVMFPLERRETELLCHIRRLTKPSACVQHLNLDPDSVAAIADKHYRV